MTEEKKAGGESGGSAWALALIVSVSHDSIRYFQKTANELLHGCNELEDALCTGAYVVLCDFHHGDTG